MNKGSDSVRISNIAADTSLSEEDKLKKLKEIAAEDKVDSRKELIENNRKKAEETRAKLRQADHDSSIKERMEILSFLKNNSGGYQYDKDYLTSISGYELEGIYKDCLEAMPEAMEEAREERARAKRDGEIIFEDYNLKESTEEKKPSQKSKEPESKIEEIADRLEIDVDNLTDVANHKKEVIENQMNELKNDEEPEIKKPINKVSKENDSKFKKMINSKAAKAALIAGAGVAALALLIINAPIALGAAAVALVGHEVNKGRKGR